MTSLMKSSLCVMMLCAAAGAAGAATSAAAVPDLMSTPECRQARTRFDAAFDQVKDRRPPTSPELDEARKSAAVACFGKAAAAAAHAGTRSPQPAVVVPQAAAASTPLPRVPLPSPGRQAPVEIGRPNHITTCDPNGCWGTDGSRLNRLGPELAGPRGICSVQGGVVACP
ncbi:MAG: hypothetical protein EOO28_31335 [Comamonadaceae bacterium]|nr:MAG: hypothetical protein EOO28_31335 [Comamonadaceae bacterium]